MIPVRSIAKPSVIVAARSAVDIEFTVPCQEHSRWCWAAVAVGVAHALSPSSPWTQCKVASTDLHQDCCRDPYPCNRDNSLEHTLDKTTGNLNESTPGGLDAAKVHAELTHKRPVCMQVEMLAFNSHYAGIKGHYQTPDGVDMVVVSDPQYDSGAYGVGDINNGAYHGGCCKQVFTTKP